MTAAVRAGRPPGAAVALEENGFIRFIASPLGDSAGPLPWLVREMEGGEGAQGVDVA